jgi:putative ABC transport system ATP-binding protein
LRIARIARSKSSAIKKDAAVDTDFATVSPASSRRSAQTDKREVVFHARGLSKIYRMGEVEVTALRSVDLDLYEGEFVVLLGPSGSGKSTLLNILGGLDAPTSGEVIFRDHNLVAAGDRELTRFRREHVGFVFQFYNLIPSLTARENVQLVTEIAENPISAEEALRLVGLGERMDHFPAQMSGGEQQRVAIARAIAKSPEVLLWTSLRALSITPQAKWCSKCWNESIRNWERRPLSSHTMRRLPGWPTVSSVWAVAESSKRAATKRRSGPPIWFGERVKDEFA